MQRLILFICLLLACSANAARLPMLQPCEANKPALCGTIEVPENRARKNGRTIPIRVMVIPASDDKAAAEPMFALTGGGPGIAAIPEASSWIADFPEIAATRDVVFFDMRGTGDSNALDCPLGSANAAIRGFLGGDLPADVITACREQLAQRADLTAYTTAAAADDMDAVRRWLGYERIHIYGSSYTARLAMVYARRYSKHVRTVTMKAVTPFAIRNPLHVAEAAQASLDRVFADCAAEAACREKYPDLAAQFASVLDALAKQPVTLTLKSGPIELTRDIFAGAIRRMLYSVDTQRSLPFVIASAARGDFAPLQPLLSAGEAIDRVLNVGLFLSVTCAEDVARFTDAEAIEAARGTFSGATLPLSLSRVCRQWPSARIPRDMEKKANVPALIISGTLDPDTPPRWGAEMQRLFPGSVHMIVEGMAHSGRPRCVRDVVTKFVLSGSTKSLDTACAKEEKRPAFAIR